MPGSRFHKAAKDGLIDVLKEASRKDINAKDADSMTPVLWAAFEGHLDALRLLCSRGGEPEKCDQFGNTALHLAAAKGHLYCVDFLIKFGVNMFTLDIDRHSAKDLAAINNRHDILSFLDVAITNFEANNRKKAKVLRELAEKQYEKRMREFVKDQQKTEQINNCSMQQKEFCYNVKNADRATLSSINNSRNSGESMLSTLKKKIWCTSQGNLMKSSSGAIAKDLSDNTDSGDSENRDSENSARSISVSFNEHEGGNRCERRREGSKVNTDNGVTKQLNDMEISTNGTRTLKYVTKNHNCNDFNGTLTSKASSKKHAKASKTESSSEGSSELYFNLNRSRSQPYLELDGREEEEAFRNKLMQRPLFGRRPLDSLTSRRSVAAALHQLADSTSRTTTTTIITSSSSSSKCSDATLNKNFEFNNCSDRKFSRPFSALTDSETELAVDDLNDEELNIDRDPLTLFLTIWGLEEFLSVFQKQQIDLDTLMLLTEDDLRTLELPLGPFRKLHFAIQERKNAFTNPGPLIDTPL